MKWIRIEDKLPDMMETVLLSNGFYVTVGWKESWELEDLSFYSCERREWPEDVKYWMSLPESPYKKEIQ